MGGGSNKCQRSFHLAQHSLNNSSEWSSTQKKEYAVNMFYDGWFRDSGICVLFEHHRVATLWLLCFHPLLLNIRSLALIFSSNGIRLSINGFNRLINRVTE